MTIGTFEAAKPMIYPAITAIMSEMSALGKDQRGFNFNFRGIDDVYNHLQKLLAKHGVFTVPEVLDEHSEERKAAKGGTLIYRILRIKYTFYAIDGSNVTATVIGEAMDSGDKASNKAMSIAHKYAYFQVFSMATAELVDPDAESHKVMAKASPSEIYKGQDHQKLWLADVFKSYGIEKDRWSELSASLLEKEITLEDCKTNIALEVSPSD